MKSRIVVAACLVLAMILAGSSALADADETPAASEDNTPEPEAKTFTSEHEIQIQGERLRYTATAGTLLLHDEKGEAIAEIGYTAYVKKDSNPATRPIMFAWNGGPGSASLWLHMGTFGPKRISVPSEAGRPGNPPYPIINAPETILDVTDLVFVDPPYDLALPSVEAVLGQLVQWLADDATVVVHRRSGSGAIPGIPGLVLSDRRKYGDAEITRFTKEAMA